jgi:hypothetical protein
VNEHEAIFVNCEVKDGDEPSDSKLKEVAQFTLPTEQVKNFGGEYGQT